MRLLNCCVGVEDMDGGAKGERDGAVGLGAKYTGVV